MDGEFGVGAAGVVGYSNSVSRKLITPIRNALIAVGDLDTLREFDKRARPELEYFPAEPVETWDAVYKQWRKKPGWRLLPGDKPKTRRECQEEARNRGFKAIFRQESR